MGYLDDILEYATGRRREDDPNPYGSEDWNDPIFSDDKLKRILLGSHAPELYPNINEPSAPARSAQMSGLYGSPSPNIEGGEGPTGGGGSFDPARARSSIYEPGPNEAAYAEALRKPRPEYTAPGKMPWWKTALEIALPKSRAVFGDPYKQAQEDYERRTGAYEGDIASKRGAANLEIGERDRQQRLLSGIADDQRKSDLYNKQREGIERQIQHYNYLDTKPEKPNDYELFQKDPAAYEKFEGIRHPVRGKGVKTVSVGGRIKVIDADTGEELNDLGEAPGGKGSGAGDAAKMKAEKIKATAWKNNEELKLNERAKRDFLDPEEIRQARQNIQDAFEQRLAAAGHNVEHYDWPVEKTPEKVKPAEPPGLLSRAASSIGSMLGGGGASGGGVQERMSKSGKPIISKDGGKTWEYK